MNVVERIEHVPLVAGQHLIGVPRLCENEGWESFSVDPNLTPSVAPGVSTVAAEGDNEAVGFAQMQGDGVWQAHLSLSVANQTFRERGIGRRLVEEAFARCGDRRVDPISTAGAEGFYESFSHKARSGFRIYPGREGEG